MTMMRLILIAGTALLAACTPTVVPKPATPAPVRIINPIVGGAEMLPGRTALANLRLSSQHRRFVAAIDAAGLAPALSAAGPRTILAPVDQAFDRLAPGTLDALMDPRSRDELTRLVQGHVLPGLHGRAQLAGDARNGGRQRTLAGQLVTIRAEGARLAIADMNGRRGTATQTDVRTSDGIVHVIDEVLLPAF